MHMILIRGKSESVIAIVSFQPACKLPVSTSGQNLIPHEIARRFPDTTASAQMHGRAGIGMGYRLC